MPDMHWSELSAAERERAMSPSSMIGGHYQPFIEAYARESARARARLTCREALRYAAGPRCLLDFFPASQAGAGLLVFIHGGYWQELSRHESALLAPAWVGAGWAHAVIDYDLAPAASLGQILQQCHQALAWLRSQAGPLGIDARRIVLAGSSAGAHLAAMLCLADAGALPGLAARPPGQPPLAAALLLSGVYELEPLVGTSINQALGLSVQEARAFSPQACLMGPEGRRPVPGHLLPPTFIACGTVETGEFRRQSRAFARSLRAHGTRVQALEREGRNHFDLVNVLGRSDDPLFKAALSFLS